MVRYGLGFPLWREAPMVARNSRFRLGRRGATAVETALALPIFLLVILGGLDIGLWLLQKARLIDATDRALTVLAAARTDAALAPGEVHACALTPLPNCNGPETEVLEILPHALTAARYSLPALSADALHLEYRAPSAARQAARINLCVTLKGVEHRFFFLHWLPGISRNSLLPPVSLCDFLPFSGLARPDNR